uniref:DUF223 domain-containing protein n=1 Tax=Panagrellus redivivus TaxID=6233 RepID=A0A7E4VRJ9_PANRE
MSSTLVNNFIPRGRYLVATGFPDGPRITGVCKGYEMSNNTIRHRMFYPNEFDDVFITPFGKKYDIKIVARFRRRQHAVNFIRNMKKDDVKELLDKAVQKIADTVTQILYTEIAVIHDQLDTIKMVIEACNGNANNESVASVEREASEVTIYDDPDSGLHFEQLPSRSSSLP